MTSIGALTLTFSTAASVSSNFVIRFCEQRNMKSQIKKLCR
jgi:hypothetical protein